MEFKNASPFSLDLPTLGVRVGPGDTFEATGDDARSLLDNPWVVRVDKPRSADKKEN